LTCQIGELRTKAATLELLKNYTEKAKKINTRTALKKDRTESGIKDTIQEHFFDKLFSSYKSVSGNIRKQEVLNAAVERLPPDIKSAIWRLRGMLVIFIQPAPVFRHYLLKVLTHIKIRPWKCSTLFFWVS
jgi:uncharacterized protein YihD (DUF1040 family)